MGRFLDSFNSNIAIDMGSSNTRICYNDKGVVLREPTVVALDKSFSPPKVIEVGRTAKSMLGRAKGEIRTASPLRYGVIAEMDLTVEMLKRFMDTVLGHRFIKFSPKVVLAVPASATGVEKKAAFETMKIAGAKKTYLIEKPVAAAVGAGLNIESPTATMIVDIGGGSTDISILSYGDILMNNNIRVAGDDFNKAIQNYIRSTKHILIGERTAENLKIKYGSVFKVEDDEEIEIRGINIIEKAPTTVNINKSNLRDALQPPIKYITKEIKLTIEASPPEVVSDIVEKGIVLTGGSALLDGITDLIQSELRIPVRVAPEPLLSVVIGADKIQNDNSYQRLLINRKH
ncbi:MAG: rod shape-determining protein [Cyanobacteriota bacterium]